MNNKVLDIIKDKPIIIPKILFQNYKKLNISEEELIVLIYIINLGNSIVYNPSVFVEDLNLDKYKVMETITNLTEKNIIDVKVLKNEKNLSEEYIYLDNLYNKLFNLIIDEKKQSISTDDTNLFLLFETELGRTISPIECEIIREWQNNYQEELIKEALKEAIYNNVRNLKYIDRILYTWKTKGITTKEDIINDKKNYRKQAMPSNVFDYNWLEEDE